MSPWRTGYPLSWVPIEPVPNASHTSTTSSPSGCSARDTPFRVPRHRCGQMRLCSLISRQQGRYTQFAIQDSRLFGPNPWKILAPPSNYLSTKGFWAAQPLKRMLDSEFLLCELGAKREGAPVVCYIRYYVYIYIYIYIYISHHSIHITS